jgi:hypothetical protein
MIVRITYSFLFLAFLPQLMTAQERVLQHFSVEEALPTNEVYHVVQDSAGFLLAATDRGIVRYDGYSFREVPFEHKVVANPAYYIYKAPSGNIYFSGLNGSIYKYRNGKLYLCPFSRKLKSLFQYSGILIANTIAEKNDSLWVSLNNDFNYKYKIGACIIAPTGEVFKTDNPPGIYFDLTNGFYYRQTSESSSASTKVPLYIRWEHGNVSSDSVDLPWKDGYIRRLFHEQHGDYHYFCIGRKVIVFYKYKKINEIFFPTNILCFTLLNRRELFLGFENGGAKKFIVNGPRLEPTAYQCLSRYSVTSIFQDTQKGTWFGTLENGIFYDHPVQAATWETSDKILSLRQNRDTLYVGFHSGRVDLFCEGRRIKQVSLKLQTNERLLRLLTSAEGNLMAVTTKGVHAGSGRGTKFLPVLNVFTLEYGGSKVYAADSRFSELHVLSADLSKEIDSRELHQRIISFCYDTTRKRLWIGTLEGLYAYENQKLINFPDSLPFAHDRIVGIRTLPGGWLAVATLGSGLVFYKDGKYLQLNNQNGLNSSIINSLDVEGDAIWIGTNKGLVEIFQRGNAFAIKHYGIAHGIPTQDIHEFEVVGRWVYIRSINGLSVISLEKLRSATKPATPFVTSVEANNSKITGSPTSFTYRVKDLKINFNSIRLSGATQQTYRYRLEGFDKNWNNTGERQVKYTNLSPGRYIFNLQAVDAWQGISSPVVTYGFYIEPAWWQHWWFPLLVIVFAALALGYVFRMRLRTIKSKNQLLLDLAENQQKALVQLISPHFIFNLLNTAQAAVLKEDRVQAASVIARFAKLMRLSMDLSRENLVMLDQEINFLHKYFELEMVRTFENFSYRITVAPDMDPAAIQIPSMLIQPFVENALKHGLMHLSGRQGCITIDFYFKDKLLICTVSDTGVGREKSAEINRNTSSYHGSAGLDITVKRLQLLHKIRHSTFVYRVTDKLTEDKLPGGTLVTFSIPYKISDETD